MKCVNPDGLTMLALPCVAGWAAYLGEFQPMATVTAAVRALT